MLLGLWSASHHRLTRARTHAPPQVEEEISLDEAARIAQTLGLPVPPIFEPDDDDDIADGAATAGAIDVSDAASAKLAAVAHAPGPAVVGVES